SEACHRRLAIAYGGSSSACAISSPLACLDPANFPRRYSQRLAVKLRRLADIREPGNVVDLDEETFDIGHDWCFGLNWRHTRCIWLKSSCLNADRGGTCASDPSTTLVVPAPGSVRRAD